MKLGLEKKDILNVTCMGYKSVARASCSSNKRSNKNKTIRRKCWSREKHHKKSNYELMFSITEKNLHSKIENVAQVRVFFCKKT